MWEVLEHLRHPTEALQRVHKILKPGGVLLIMVPNFGSLVNRLMHEKGARLLAILTLTFLNLQRFFKYSSNVVSIP